MQKTTEQSLATKSPIGLTIRQVVELSGFGRSTIYQELAAGRLAVSFH